MLSQRRIILVVSGGIAAYKAPVLVRELIKSGAEVRVVLTAKAERFVAPSALEVLSRHPVYGDLFHRDSEFPVLHVGLAEWADLILIAPATAHILGRAAQGLADDLATTLLLCARVPIVAAPAMEENMLLHEAVQSNAETLHARGWHWIEPEVGELASGASGAGRMVEPQDIAARLDALLNVGDLVHLRMLVTAGPTFEDIDPVRFIGNRSTGKMGFALAQRARARGAQVALVAGPTHLPTPTGVERINVRSAAEMQRTVGGRFAEVDVAILAAAVADYRVAHVADEKIRRGDGGRSIQLVENPDIAAELGACKDGQTLVLFAMETDGGIERAREKLARKGGDLIALNNLRDEGAGFAVDTNVLTLIDRMGKEVQLPKMSKLDASDQILDWVRAERAIDA